MRSSNKGIEEANQLLSLFLYSMQYYDRTIKQLPVSEGLQAFDGSSSTAESVLASFESDCVAIDVRLMLQRKYFTYSDSVHLKKLFHAAQSTGLFDQARIDDFANRAILLNSKPVELSLSDGNITSGQYANAEDATYGSLLHADLNRSLRLIRFPQEMRLLSLAPYILTREELLLAFRDLCLDVGLISLKETHIEKEAILRWCESSETERNIKRSPYWSNIVGRDFDEAELEGIADDNPLDDNIAILVATFFFNQLQKHPLDVQLLRELVWQDYWEDWGDFEQAANIVRTIENPGGSTRVMHEGGANYAQVKILPHVLDPWITETPQLFRSSGCLVCLTKRKGIWKVNGIAL